jgi:hypothetical protein
MHKSDIKRKPEIELTEKKKHFSLCFGENLENVKIDTIIRVTAN